MIRTVLIDDERAAIESTSILLSEFFENIELVGTAGSVKDGIALIEKTSPDLVLLDVQMEDGTGFDVLDALPESSFEVIFITAYGDYAIDAIRRRAIDYLVKPISIEDLKRSIDAVWDTILLRKNQIENSPSPIDSIALPGGKGMKIVPLDDVICFEAERSYTNVNVNGEMILVSKNLKTFDDLLKNDPRFVRVHRSAIVNIKHITEILRTDGGHIVLTHQAVIHLPARGREVLVKILEERGLLLSD